LLPLVVIGALGVPVLLELVDLIFRRRPLSRHSLVVLALMAACYLVGLLALTKWSPHFTASLATGSALSIDARTGGLPLASAASLARASQWILILLMLVGGAPGGAAGGLKVTALFHAWRGTRRALAGEVGARVTGIAATWITAYGTAFLAIVISMLAFLPEMAADRLVFLAASALSNCGLSFEPVVLTGGGLWTDHYAPSICITLRTRSVCRPSVQGVDRKISTILRT
jgi:trk system potassium uptake protein TrkH